MRIEQLEYLAVVVRLGSFRRAVEELHISQPALSESVRRLERELGIDLLERGRHGATVSNSGRELFPHVLTVLDSVDRLRQAAGEQLRDPPISAVDEGTTLLLNGSKQFNTGLPVSDRVFIGTALEGTEDVFFVYADSRVPEVIYGEDWDTLGQRSTASGSAKVSGLRARWDHALGFADKTFIPQPANITPGLTSQTLMPTFYVSLARGALDKAVDYIKNHGRAWLHSNYERAVDEPYVVDGIGQLQSRLLAAEALVRDASEKVSAALDAPNEITPEQRGELAVLLSAAKTVAVEVGIEVTTKLFELTGGRSTARSFELDRFFRDLRTQSLHDPVAQKRIQVGSYLLRGEYPLAVDWYS